MKRIINFLSIFIFLSLVNLNINAATLNNTHFSKQELFDIQGHYSTIYGYIYIQVRGKYASTNFDGKHIRLVKHSNGRFYPKYKLLSFIPVPLGDMSFELKNNNGKQQILMHEKNKQAVVVAQKFQVKTIPNPWKKRLGNYKAKSIKGNTGIKHIKLHIHRGILLAYINKTKNPYPLVALSNNQLFSPSSGANQKQALTILEHGGKLKLNYKQSKLELTKT